MAGLVRVEPGHDAENFAAHAGDRENTGNLSAKFSCIAAAMTTDTARKVTRAASLGRVRPMRMVIRGAVALVILVAAYWGWALAGAAQLASAASRDDPEAVMERVDLQPLIRSLSSQISRAYLDQNPELRKLLSEHGLGGGVAINAAGAELLLRAFLTPENIAALLNRGRVERRRPGRRDAFRRALARRGVPRPALAGPDELLFRRSAELRRWPAKSRWAVSPPHASFRRHVAPVGRRHSRAGHCPGGAADRA